MKITDHYAYMSAAEYAQLPYAGAGAGESIWINRENKLVCSTKDGDLVRQIVVTERPESWLASVDDYEPTQR